MTNQNPSDIEKYLRELLECPVCMETIKSVPVYQCANGHVICKDCIEKLNNCPICRNDSELRRSLKLENIVQRLEGIKPENVGPPTPTPNLQKWGKGFVRSYGTINEPSQAASIGINPQANPWRVTPWQDSTRQTRRQARRQATPRQASTRQTRRQARRGQVTTGPIITREVMTRTRQIPVNNQDVEAALRIDPAENSAQSLSDGQRMALCIAISFFTILIFAFLFCLLMWSVGCCTDL